MRRGELMSVIIYHNPKCSKSRQTLALLEEKDVHFDVVEYLKEMPSEKEILEILEMLDEPLDKVVRTKEDDYQADPFELKDKILVAKKLKKVPRLLERPIVVKDGKAVLGRPPENIQKLF